VRCSTSPLATAPAGRENPWASLGLASRLAVCEIDRSAPALLDDPSNDTAGIPKKPRHELEEFLDQLDQSIENNVDQQFHQQLKNEVHGSTNSPTPG
jgi:hypothetical protein